MIRENGSDMSKYIAFISWRFFYILIIVLVVIRFCCFFFMGEGIGLEGFSNLFCV